MADRDLQNILNSGELSGGEFSGTIVLRNGSNPTELNVYRDSSDGAYTLRGKLGMWTATDGSGFVRLTCRDETNAVEYEARLKTDGNFELPDSSGPTANKDVTTKEYVDSAIAKVADDVATINSETFDLFEYSGSLGRSLSRTECNDIFTQFLGHLPNENVKLTVIDDDNKVFTITYLASRDKYFYTKLSVR